MTKILITGASGGLGSQLWTYFSKKYDTLGLCHHQQKDGLIPIDLTEPGGIFTQVQSFDPDIIIHTVGLTDVYLCDKDIAKALAVNTHTTLHVRQAAESISAKMVHISTNDVFGGEEGMYTETDTPKPVNMYSWTKYMAEQMLYRYDNSLILRFTILSWFTSGKIAFPQWIVSSLNAQQKITLFEDQYNSPLFTESVAPMIESLFDARGIYHLGSERKSRYETGLAIAQHLGLPTDLIQKGSVDDVDLFAPRPRDVSLDVSKVAKDWSISASFDSQIKALIHAYPKP